MRLGHGALRMGRSGPIETSNQTFGPRGEQAPRASWPAVYAYDGRASKVAGYSSYRAMAASCSGEQYFMRSASERSSKRLPLILLVLWQFGHGMPSGGSGYGSTCDGLPITTTPDANDISRSRGSFGSIMFVYCPALAGQGLLMRFQLSVPNVMCSPQTSHSIS